MPNYQHSDPKRLPKKQNLADVLRSKLSYNASHTKGKQIGDYNATHSHGKSAGDRLRARNQASGGGKPTKVPFSSVTSRANQAPKIGPALMAKARKSLGSVPPGVNPTKPVSSVAPGQPYNPNTGQVGGGARTDIRRRKPRNTPNTSGYPR